MTTLLAQSGTVSLYTAGLEPVTRAMSSANVEAATCRASASEESVMMGTSEP